MKCFILFMLLISTQSWASERVIRVIKHETHDQYLRLNEDSFEPNLQGYACPWPGLRAPYLFANLADLQHGRNGLSHDVFGIKASDLERQFCHWPSAEGVFGPDFVIGKEVTLKVQKELALITNLNSTKDIYLRETLSAKFMGRNLESIAYVLFEGKE